jgi:hypothetical protein
MTKVQQIVDELGELNERITPAQMALSRDEDRAKILEANLRTELAALPPDQPDIILGERYGCKVGAAKQATSIKNMKVAMTAVRDSGKRVIDLFTCTLEKLKDAVGKEKYEELVFTTRTGPRSIDTYRLNPKE